MELFTELIKIKDQISVLEKEIEQKKTEFMNSIAFQISSLEELKSKETILKNDVIKKMEEDNINSFEQDDKIINKQVKETLIIEDATAFKEAVNSNKTELLKSGWKEEDILNATKLKINIASKLNANKLIKDYQSLTGSLLNGVDIGETKYITIKNK